MTTERVDSRLNRLWTPIARRVSVIALAVVVLFFVARFGLIEVFTAWNRTQFASRPELENWVLPGYGVETPATLWAGATALAVFVILAFHATRLPHRPGRQTR